VENDIRNDQDIADHYLNPKISRNVLIVRVRAVTDNGRFGAIIWRVGVTIS